MVNFIKFGIPVLTVIAIVLVGFLLLRPDQVSLTTVSSQGCTIKYQPNVKQYDAYPSFCIDPKKSYQADILTDKGQFTIKLLSANAPQTVNSFVFLSKSGFYKDIIFHRVIAGFVIQAGDPEGTGAGGPGYSFKDEINPSSIGLSTSDIKSNQDAGYKYTSSLETVKILTGTVAMANAGPNTNGSQWFIALTDQPTLDGKYTPFGEVTSGMDVVNAIAAVKTDTNNKPLTPIKIEKIDIVESK